MMLATRTITVLLFSSVLCLHAHAQDELSEDMNSTIRVANAGFRPTMRTNWFMQYNGSIRHPDRSRGTVDAGRIFVDSFEVIKLTRGQVELTNHLPVDGTTYLGSLATDTPSAGGVVRISVEGNESNGITGFVDSVYCPASILLSGFALDSLSRSLTLHRAQDLTLTWNPDPHTDSVRIQISELCNPSDTTSDGSEPQSIVMWTADDGSHTITSSELGVLRPSAKEVFLVITRDVRKEVVRGTQRVLLVGEAWVSAVLRIE
jgi:hypothetical protein